MFVVWGLPYNKHDIINIDKGTHLKYSQNIKVYQKAPI